MYDNEDEWNAEFCYRTAFNCECRAYGRLKEAKREDLAVRAHGYLHLSEHQEQQMNSLYCSDDIWYRSEWQEGQLVHAIVKDLVEGVPHWKPADVPRMYTDLMAFHELGILIRDIHDANYMNSLVVDLSRAWTVPDLVLEEYPWHLYIDERSKDAYELWIMVRDWNKEHEEPHEQVPMPPGLPGYVDWCYKDLGKHPCYPYDLRWKAVWEKALSEGKKHILLRGGMRIIELEDPEWYPCFSKKSPKVGL
jgi:hypothetical protein